MTLNLNAVFLIYFCCSVVFSRICCPATREWCMLTSQLLIASLFRCYFFKSIMKLCKFRIKIYATVTLHCFHHHQVNVHVQVFCPINSHQVIRYATHFKALLTNICGVHVHIFIYMQSCLIFPSDVNLCFPVYCFYSAALNGWFIQTKCGCSLDVSLTGMTT